MSKKMQVKPIDFVITWVDGNDEAWLSEKNKYQTKTMFEDDRQIRYRDWDNLQYWFRAVERYAPWVRTIHFVTWGHIPQWLNEDNSKLHIVKHEDYIPSQYLPTFNSHTIELNLHRIKGLAEQFVYFNDDVFLNHPVEPEDFFKDGLPCDILGLDCIYFGKDSAGVFHGNDLGIINNYFNCIESFRENPKKWIHYKYGIKAVIRSLFLLHKKYFPGFLNQHVSNSYRKSTFEEVWQKEAEVLDATCRCRFREVTNVNQWVMKYWQLASGQFVPRYRKFGKYFSLKNDITHVENAICNGKNAVICINDTMKTVDFETMKSKINKVLEKKYPDKSSFEK